MKKHSLSVLLGLAIVALGVIYAGKLLGFWQLNLSFAGWWTLFIVVPSILSIINSGLNVFNCMFTVIGVLLFMGAQEFLEDGMSYKLIAPAIIIIVGLSVVFRKSVKTSAEGTNGIFAGNQGEHFFAVFGSNSQHFKGEVFRGANTYAIFGGVELHLRDAIIKRDCAITAYSIFGGTEITLPENVRAVFSNTPVFGGVDNKFTPSKDDTAPTVYIRTVSVFGGAEIK